jgi:hypothetical protein
MLAEAADIYSTRSFHQAATALGEAADILPAIERSVAKSAARLSEAADIYGSHDFVQAATALAGAADILPTIDRTLTRSVEQLVEAAESISSSVQQMRRFGGEW